MTAPASFGRALVSVGVLLLLTLLMIPFFYRPLIDTPPPVDRGVMSFAGSQPLTTPIQLAAPWSFQWIGPGTAPAFTLPVPGEWEGATAPDGTVLTGKGRARYSLTLRALPPGAYQLYVPVTNAANRILIDGKLVSSRGTMGSDAATTRYDWRAQFVRFQADGGDIAIEIELAAFLHRSNGLPNAPVIGLDEPMNGWVARGWIQELIILAGLLLVAAFNFVIFLFRRQDKASLYFSLAAVFLLPMSMILGFDNLFSVLLPGVPFAAMILLGYCSTWAVAPPFLAYVRELYPDDTPVGLTRLLLGVWAVLLLGQLGLAAAGDTYLSSQWFRLAPLAGLCAFAFIALVTVRAVRNRRASAIIFSVGAITFIAALLVFNLDDAGFIDWQAANHINTASVGTMALLFANIMVVADRWTLSIQTAETMNSDLSQLLEVNSAVTTEARLETLLARIVAVTTRILNAERSTLFLHDAKAGQLWSLVAEGLEAREIRIDDHDGIVGDVFQTARTASVADAYADPRFNREIDTTTGFKTRSLIAAPVIARDGRKLGVLQALNGKGGAGFSAADEARLSAFAAQAAVAIDNATLFSEVVSSRNYNESILASMSAGVITLDQEQRIAKINDAAAAIIEVPAERLDGVHAHELLADTNAWLIEEIDAVTESGASKVLLDVEIRTGAGRAKSVNLSIVPLIDEGEAAGVVVLIEDISEGKRLQGAMRRFMPQKVVDQVLDREDDLLFGTACRASVLFADIRDFTSISESLDARETVDMLNEVFTDLFEAVAETDGILDKYIGDAVMAVYGVPFAGDRDARNSVDAAVQMVRMIGTINERRRKRGLDDLRLGVGIATGDVVAGTIGSPKRMDYTVIGDSVNLASRLQDTTKALGCAIIVDAATAAQVEGVHPLRELDPIRVRGRQQLERIYEVVI